MSCYKICVACVGHSDGLETGAMSSDDSMVMTAAYDKSARIWDLASGKCLAVLASSAQVYPALGPSVPLHTLYTRMSLMQGSALHELLRNADCAVCNLAEERYLLSEK